MNRFALALCAALALSLSLPACAAPQRRVTHVTVVASAPVVAALHAEHMRVYREATDALMERIRARGGTEEDYEREVRPFDREFSVRTSALSGLSAALYGTAGANDAPNDAAARAAALRRMLQAVTNAIDALEHGGALPPVPVPPEISALAARLRAMAAEASR